VFPNFTPVPHVTCPLLGLHAAEEANREEGHKVLGFIDDLKGLEGQDILMWFVTDVLCISFVVIWEPRKLSTSSNADYSACPFVHRSC
jgi:hypothetical protein